MKEAALRASVHVPTVTAEMFSQLQELALSMCPLGERFLASAVPELHRSLRHIASLISRNSSDAISLRIRFSSSRVNLAYLVRGRGVPFRLRRLASAMASRHVWQFFLPGFGSSLPQRPHKPRASNSLRRSRWYSGVVFDVVPCSVSKGCPLTIDVDRMFPLHSFLKGESVHFRERVQQDAHISCFLRDLCAIECWMFWCTCSSIRDVSFVSSTRHRQVYGFLKEAKSAARAPRIGAGKRLVDPHCYTMGLQLLRMLEQVADDSDLLKSDWTLIAARPPCAVAEEHHFGRRLRQVCRPLTLDPVVARNHRTRPQIACARLISLCNSIRYQPDDSLKHGTGIRIRTGHTVYALPFRRLKIPRNLRNSRAVTGPQPFADSKSAAQRSSSVCTPSRLSVLRALTESRL